MSHIEKDGNVSATRAPAEYNKSSDQVQEKRHHNVTQGNDGGIHEDREVKADSEPYIAEWLGIVSTTKDTPVFSHMIRFLVPDGSRR